MKIHQNPSDKQGRHWMFPQRLGGCFAVLGLVAVQQIVAEMIHQKEGCIGELSFGSVDTSFHQVVDIQSLEVPFYLSLIHI